MSLTEKAVEFAWKKLKESAEKTLDDETKDTEKSLLSKLLKRIQPTARERTAKSLLTSFSRLFENQFQEHQIFAGETSQLAADLRTFLANPSVQGWLAEPLDLSIDHLDHQRLAAIWRDLPLTPLPADFDWELVANLYFVKVRSVIQKDPELRALADSDALRQLRDAMNRLAGLDPGFRLQEYRSRILTRFSYLKFDSFHVTGSDLERRVQLWKVFVPQDVKENLPPLELPKEHIRKLEAEGEISPAERRQLEEEGQLQHYRQRYQESPRQPVTDLLHDSACPYAVIVGDPGSGKSTLLEWLLLEWAEDHANRPLPLFVELRQCARESADWKGDFCQYFALADDPLFAFNAEELQKHLTSHDAILLIDGLDEVFDLNQRKQITDRVLNFKSRFPRCRVVVTSRQIGFQKEVWLNNGFRLFTLQDFDQPQIELFLDRWHQLVFALEPAEVQRLKPRLLASIREYLPIRELAANPLLLTMMAVINRMEPIPRDRRALYERCAELLVHRWEVDRGRMAGPEEQNTGGVATLKSPLDLGDKKTLLEIIAHAMQNGEAGLAGNVIEEDELKRLVTAFLKDNSLAQEPGKTAREIIHQLRERNFILCFVGAGRYSFVHRTFLEFFCASYFAQRLDAVAILEQVIKPHWRDERWHEVIRLLVAEKSKQPESVRGVIDFLLAQNTTRERAVNVFLAADCVLDLRNPAELGATRAKLLRSVEKCFDFALDFYHEPWGEEQELVNRIQASAVSRWAALQNGLPSTRTSLTKLAVDQAWVVRRAALQELARGWKDDADVLPLLKNLANNDEDEDVRSAALQELARSWKNDADVLPLLKKRTDNDPHWQATRTALQELARGWKDDAEVLPLLKDHANNDDRPSVRSAAFQELARGWKDDAEVLPLLKDRANNDDRPSVRSAAFQELARSWKDDAEVLPLLKDRAKNDDRSSVRRAALQELARGWKDDADVLQLLKDCARNDDNSAMRNTALQQLASGWKDDADVLPLLKDRARNDKNYSVRNAALQELARRWKDDADVLPLLKDRARNDKNYNVRNVAFQELARAWKDDAEVLPLLKESAKNADNSRARNAAIEELARNWKDDPDVLPLLKDRANNADNSRVRNAALQELARSWKDDPDVLPLMKDHARNDDNSRVRRAALQELARGWKDDADVLPLLKDRARSDDISVVRNAALQELVRGWKDDADILPILKDRAHNDDDNNVRNAAIWELARGWKDDADVLPLLKDRAHNDDDNNLRNAAIWELARGWKDDADVPSLLKDRALNDDANDVRSVALQLLARDWKGDPDVLPLLKGRVRNDEDDDVRNVALQELARGWKDDPDVQAFVQAEARCLTISQTKPTANSSPQRLS